MKILTDYFTTHCTVKTRQRFGNAHTTKPKVLLLAMALTREPSTRDTSFVPRGPID